MYNLILRTNYDRVWDFNVDEEQNRIWGEYFHSVFDWRYDEIAAEFDSSYKDGMTMIRHLIHDGAEDVTDCIREICDAYEAEMFGTDEEEWEPEVSAEDYREWVDASCGRC